MNAKNGPKKRGEEKSQKITTEKGIEGEIETDTEIEIILEKGSVSYFISGKVKKKFLF